jgi:O-antigen/teichoic acid export membrane protein
MGLMVLAALWIPRWGLIGAALAAALAVVLVSVGALLAVWRSIGVQPFDRRTVRVILSGLAAAGALILVSRAGISATILRPGVNAIVSLSVFFGVLLGGGMPAEERAVLTLAGQRLRARREDRRRSSGD